MILSAFHPVVTAFLLVPAATLGGMVDWAELHPLFIALHAVAGVLSFLSGCLFLLQSNGSDRRRGLYFLSLVGMVGFLMVAMAVWWTQYTDFERIVFPCLLVLGVYMLYRGLQARSSIISATFTSEYIHDIGFTLFALFEGFIIVFLININAPIGVIVVVAILGVILGRMGITRTENNMTNADAVV